MEHRKRMASILLVAIVILVLASQAAMAAPGGTGPEDALTPVRTWKSLNPNVVRWYAFHYNGDGSPVTVKLQVEPHENAEFAVWTPEAIHRRGLGLKADPVGRGSPDPFADGVLSWSGGFNTPGEYYVVLEHAGNSPATSYYLLEINGDGVSLTAPMPTAVAKPKPVKTPSKPTAKTPPSGKLVFQTTFGGPFYTINADGTNLQRITDGMDATWSPDGSEIAFIRWREPRGVWVINPTTGNEWRAFDWSETRWPSWSSDGGRILFSRLHGGRTDSVTRCFWGFCFSFGPDPNWKLGIVRTRDGDFREPPCSDSSKAPMWSPVEDRIIYADTHGLRVQSEDGEVSYLITDDSRDTSPAWSPDGQRVAFTRRQHDHWEVYVVDADGRNLKRLTHTPFRPNGEVGNSASPAWSPDGQYIAFFTDRLGKWEIWIVRANGGGLRPMFPDELDGLRLDYASLGERAISWTK